MAAVIAAFRGPEVIQASGCPEFFQPNANFLSPEVSMGLFKLFTFVKLLLQLCILKGYIQNCLAVKTY